MDKDDKNPPAQWGVYDLRVLSGWQDQRIEVHLIGGKKLWGELRGYGSYALTLQDGDKFVLVNKGAVAWVGLVG